MNKTTMGGKLMAGIEAVSGIDVKDITVHYNSAKPAQLSAVDNAGIHTLPGNKNLPHKAWRVIKQYKRKMKRGI